MPAVSERRLALAADTASDLMRPDVAAIPRDATFAEALAFFIDRNLTVSPVLGGHGEPVGVLSVTDVLIHVRECVVPDGGGAGRVAPASAERLMTPTVFTVDARAPAADVVRDMLRSRVHHLFVTDDAGRIVGVISACDVLRHLA
jgi:CBS-domain-containing membrane protein